MNRRLVDLRALTAALRAIGPSDERAGRRLDRSFTTVWRWRHGRSIPTETDVRLLARLARVDPESLWLPPAGDESSGSDVA